MGDSFLENNVLTVKTVQISPMRTLMTALKDILLETNIIFKKDGIRIINMDKSHTILAHLFLRADNFELYECKEEKIVIGVNMFHLFKLMNSIDNNDTLSMYVEKEDYNDGVISYLGLKFENGDIKQCKTQADSLSQTRMSLKFRMLSFPQLLACFDRFPKLCTIWLHCRISWKLRPLRMKLFLSVPVHSPLPRFAALKQMDVWSFN